MRQLRLTKTPTPAQQAEAAAALTLLEGLPVPAGFTPEAYAAQIVPHFGYLVSVAKQYQNQGVSLANLVLAGYWAAVRSKPDKWWAWRVRQGVLGAGAG